MPNNDATPAVFIHCEKAYKLMMDDSSIVYGPEVEDDEESSPSEGIVVYKGKITKLIVNDMNLSVPYFSSVRKALMEMGCIRQIRRGGGTADSEWEMIKEPTMELWEERRPKRATNAKKPQLEMLEDQIAQLNTRLNRLESQHRVLLEAMSNG